MQISVFMKLTVALFDLYVTARQHRRFHPAYAPSARVAAFIPRQFFLRSQQYGRARSSFHLRILSVEATLDSAAILLYLSPSLWDLVCLYFPYSQLRQTLLFFAILGIFSILLDIPPMMYSAFVLDSNFYQLPTDPVIFLRSLFDDIRHSALLGLPLITFLHYLMRYVEQFHFGLLTITTFITLSISVILLIYSYPFLFAQLFINVQPLHDQQLKQKAFALAKRLNFPLHNIYISDSNHSPFHSHAFIVGHTERWFCISRSLLHQTAGQHDQVVSLLCHEIGHWKKAHVIPCFLKSVTNVILLLMLYTCIARHPDLFKSFGFTQSAPPAVRLLLFNYVLSPLDDMLSPLHNMMSRRLEFEADAYVKVHGLAQPLSEVLLTTSICTPINMSPDLLYTCWNYSRPTLVERLDALGVAPRPKPIAVGRKQR